MLLWRISTVVLVKISLGLAQVSLNDLWHPDCNCGDLLPDPHDAQELCCFHYCLRLFLVRLCISEVSPRRPWMAYLELTDQRNETQMCGGSVLSSRLVLTAAHCFCNNQLCTNSTHDGQGRNVVEDIEKYVRVWVGIFDTKEMTRHEGWSQRYRVSEVIVHEQYDDVYNDIALIKLKRDIDFEKQRVKPICLPLSNSFPDTQGEAWVSGWGTETDAHCTTDASGPTVQGECAFPFMVKGVRHDECTFMPTPATWDRECTDFTRASGSKASMPVLIASVDGVLHRCFNASSGSFGWCGSRTPRMRAINNWYDESNDEEMVQQDHMEITASKHWGWCTKSCSRSHRPVIRSRMHERSVDLLSFDQCRLISRTEHPLQPGKLVELHQATELCAAKKRHVVGFERWKRRGNEHFVKLSNQRVMDFDYFGGNDACQGDSGGPLYVFIENRDRMKAFVVGIISRGHGCALRNRAGVYTRITAFLQWIRKHAIKHQLSCPK